MGERHPLLPRWMLHSVSKKVETGRDRSSGVPTSPWILLLLSGCRPWSSFFCCFWLSAVLLLFPFHFFFIIGWGEESGSFFTLSSASFHPFLPCYSPSKWPTVFASYCWKFLYSLSPGADSWMYEGRGGTAAIHFIRFDLPPDISPLLQLWSYSVQFGQRGVLQGRTTQKSEYEKREEILHCPCYI